ncbi:MAG: peptide chain release factor 1 [Elusimicrobia bacterium]|nr:peptide chain release factor 1 [Elusimicrobiota bacterium]
MSEQFKKIEQEFSELERQFAQEHPQEPLSGTDLAAKAKRHAELAPTVAKILEYRRIEKEMRSLEHFQKDKDPELRRMAEVEIQELKNRLASMEPEIQEALLPRDPSDLKNAFLEIRAGAGGEEAALFAAELLRMYTRYAEAKGWKMQLLSLRLTGLGGYKEAIALVSSKEAYRRLKWEGGVHRVQRVPKTEASGRIHTSTVTVAVLQEAEEVEIQIDPKELKIDTYRAGGHGGQNVNKVETAVRVTHLPTGLVVQCQNERSQHQNRLACMKMLRAKLYSRARDTAALETSSTRRRQVGTGERSEKIRTYNFSQNRVTDHRINTSWHNLPVILEGNLDEILRTLQEKLTA